MMVALAVICSRVRTQWVVWSVLTAVVAVLSAACSGEESAPTETLPDSQVAETEAVDEHSPISAAAEQPSQQTPERRQRQVRDPILLLIVEADALERNGFWEEALATRNQALAAGTSLQPSARTDLQLDQARLLLKLRRPADASEMAAAVDGLVTAEAARRQQLLPARAAIDLGASEAAIDLLMDYVNSDSPAWYMAALEAAKLLQAVGRSEEAIDAAERALDGTLPRQDRLRAIHLAATELDIIGETDRALLHYEDLLQRSPWRDDQAAALSRIGAIRSDRGDVEQALQAWRRLVNDYRAYPEALEALERLNENDAPVDDLRLGLILYEQDERALARAAMLRVLTDSSDLAERVAAEFYVAAIHQANGDLDSARLGYEVVIGRDPTDPLAAEAAWQLARFAFEAGDEVGAAGWWEWILTEHTQSSRGWSAALNWSLESVRGGDWSEAARRFRNIANRGVDLWGATTWQMAMYWSALMHREAGESESSLDLAQKALDRAPGSYYGLRAATVFDLESMSPPTLSVESWLIEVVEESGTAPQALDQSDEWLAARDLRHGGFNDAADRLLLSWIDELAVDAWSLLGVSRFLASEREVSASARAADRLIGMTVGAWRWPEAPTELLRLAYPQPWNELALRYSAESGADPLLLWSLIRRESFYDSDATGAAGEVGLTQVIPLTGGDIAAALGVAYEHDDLARPALAIRFGSWYLGQQLLGFDGEPAKALAAYNGGPGNAARWESEAIFPGQDGFKVSVDFPTTSAYIEHIIVYRAIYEALDQVRP